MIKYICFNIIEGQINFFEYTIRQMKFDYLTTDVWLTWFFCINHMLNELYKNGRIIRPF